MFIIEHSLAEALKTTNKTMYLIPKKLIVTVTFLCLGIFSFCQNPLNKILVKSIKKQDSVLYKKALTDWSNSSNCWTNEYLDANDTILAINNLFQAFYSVEHDSLMALQRVWNNGFYPVKSDSLLLIASTSQLLIGFTAKTLNADSVPKLVSLKNNYETSGDIYKNSRRIYFIDSLITYETHTFKNLKPCLRFNSTRPLILNDTLEKSLNSLLTGKGKKPEKNRAFFYTKVSLISPKIDQIIFDKPMDNCMIVYSWNSQGGYALAKRNGKYWQVTESTLTWFF